MLAFMLPFVVIGLARPFAGYLLWGWGGLVALNYYLFGFMQPWPYVQIFALITLASLLMNRERDQLAFKGGATYWLWSLFLVHSFICALLAYPGLERNWELWGNIAKTTLFCFLMPLLANSRLRIHALVVMIAIGTSFHGVLDGLKFLASGGAHRAQIISKFGDNNHLAMVLLMAIPILYYLYLYSRILWVRWGFLLAILLMVLAVVSTNSRGGLIGLLVVAIWLVYRSRRRLMGAFLISISVLLVAQLAPDTWVERMDTIQDAQVDDSFMGRVVAWKVSAAIAQEHPFFGGGLRAVQSFPVWLQFKDAPGFLGFIQYDRDFLYAPAAHSIWFEVLGDQGFVGFFIFVAIIVNSFLLARRVRQLVLQNGDTERWAFDLSNFLTISLVVYVVTGSALSAAYFELPYVCMMLLETLRQQQLRVSESRTK